MCPFVASFLFFFPTSTKIQLNHAYGPQKQKKEKQLVILNQLDVVKCVENCLFFKQRKTFGFLLCTFNHVLSNPKYEFVTPE